MTRRVLEGADSYTPSWRRDDERRRRVEKGGEGVASAMRGRKRNEVYSQVDVLHLVHTADELTRERQGRRRRRRYRRARGGINVHRLVLWAFKERSCGHRRGLRHVVHRLVLRDLEGGSRGLRRRLRHSSQVRVVFLEKVCHEEGDEGA